MHGQNALVVSRKTLAEGIFSLEVRPEYRDDVAPGQFVHIAPGGTFLRRPISIAEVNEAEQTLTLIIQKIGIGTESLAECDKGTTLKMLSPLGRGFFGSWRPGQKIWLVGGGVGVAPLILLARRLSESGCRVESFTGFRSERHVYGVKDLERYGAVHQSVGGIVTDLTKARLAGERPDAILACGPTPMLKAVQAICLEHEIAGQASLEEYMGCGIGACLVCNCKIKIADGASSGNAAFTYKRVCADGPVFDIREVVFDA